jgi:hypothetical protein
VRAHRWLANWKAALPKLALADKAHHHLRSVIVLSVVFQRTPLVEKEAAPVDADAQFGVVVDNPLNVVWSDGPPNNASEGTKTRRQSCVHASPFWAGFRPSTLVFASSGVGGIGIHHLISSSTIPVALLQLLHRRV